MKLIFFEYSYSKHVKEMKEKERKMKIRTGFVSNSSSSSFMIGIGKIKDGHVDEVSEIMEKHNVYKYDYKIHTVKEELESYKERPSKLIQESFTGDWVEIDTNKLKDSDTLFKIYFLHGNDYDFMNEDYDYNYDIDEDFFDNNNTYTALNEIKEKGLLEDFKMAYGAGRNG